MTGSPAVRLFTLTTATTALVLGATSPASAQCAAPTYHGGIPLWIGECPETVAGGASAVVWAVVIAVAVLWIARALSRPESPEAGDLELIDQVFSHGQPIKSEDDR
ncbi:hypothetical protein CP967_33575 [Streptomyces nitrosporeus]|uniref:Uncharacterized protein n=1 Tax=Streptomyces nitrosporeus TaxID=28894 RepID=A0A5J6FJU4_9ACTN|nr:hypothetical protein [Streptomyces nitrosporeus]QEU76251.1 hypothetical protein CP967_33575 [Streptomyces nitrosporeus]GGZ21913.1 hypothetical protein GCM10010327_61110 [Streptomyces nitrosporeus]